MKHRNVLLATTAAGVALGGLSWFVAHRLTEPTDVLPTRTGEQFPTVIGRLLSGQSLTIPNELTDRVGLLIVAWDYAARVEVEEWGRILLEKYGILPGVAVYEVAMISGIGPLMRKAIDAAMARSTPGEMREHVLTVYGDLRRLRKQLEAPSRATATVFLLGRTGRLAWRMDGAPTPEKLDELREALAAQGVEEAG